MPRHSMNAPVWSAMPPHTCIGAEVWIWLMIPPRACAAKSADGLAESGPLGPNPYPAEYTSLGLISCTDS